MGIGTTADLICSITYTVRVSYTSFGIFIMSDAFAKMHCVVVKII